MKEETKINLPKRHPSKKMYKTKLYKPAHPASIKLLIHSSDPKSFSNNQKNFHVFECIEPAVNEPEPVVTKKPVVSVITVRSSSLPITYTKNLYVTSIPMLLGYKLGSTGGFVFRYASYFTWVAQVFLPEIPNRTLEGSQSLSFT